MAGDIEQLGLERENSNTRRLGRGFLVLVGPALDGDKQFFQGRMHGDVILSFLGCGGQRAIARPVWLR